MKGSLRIKRDNVRKNAVMPVKLGGKLMRKGKDVGKRGDVREGIIPSLTHFGIRDT